MSEIPIKSSMIKSAAYDAAAQRLTITFNSGDTVACSPVTAEMFGHFLISDSKGRFFWSHLAKLATKEPSAAAAPPVAEPLHMVAEDDCCAAALNLAISRGKVSAAAESWVHRKCGCEWRSRLVDGVVHWTPVTIARFI